MGDSAQLLSELLDHAAQGVIVIDRSDHTDAADADAFALRYANRAAHALLGTHDLAEIERRLYEPLQGFASVCSTRVPSARISVEHRDADGATVALALWAVPVLSSAVAVWLERDRGARASPERTELSDFLDSIIEHMPAMVFVKDAADLRFERFNRAGEQLLGISREVLLGKTDYDLFPKSQADFFVAKDRRVLAGKRLLDIPEEPIETPTGTRYLHTRKIPLLGPDGQPEHLLGISLDITERKRAAAVLQRSHDELSKEVMRRTAELRRETDVRTRAEQALAETERQLRHAQKMEAIGRLAGGVAHDFNNLLSVVISYCDLALLRMQPSDRSRADVEEIRRAGQRAAELTRQLLAFSRQQVLEPKVLSVSDVVLGVAPMLERLLGEDIVLAIATAPELSLVKADPSQLEQVIMNLVVNARDAMPTGGELRIETWMALRPPSGAGAQHEGPHVVLRVSDTGEGMDGETLARIFEPFFTTKERGKGTGLGLSTVFGIVRQSGGAIVVDSRPGGGARFDVYLPVTSEQPASKTRPSSPVAEDLRGEATLLLVEDDAQVRTLCAHVLQQLGYSVLVAARPSQAIAAAAGYDGEIHLLLTDVVMPEMGGRMLAEHLTQQRPHMRVLFMSGYADDATMRHGVSEATLAFIPKPFTPERLARSVKQCLIGPRTSSRPPPQPFER